MCLIVSELLEYSAADHERREWNILRGVLANATGEPLSDFRSRHGVAADGALGGRLAGFPSDHDC